MHIITAIELTDHVIRQLKQNVEQLGQQDHHHTLLNWSPLHGADNQTQ